MKKNRQGRVQEHQSLDVSGLRAGDILLYSPDTSWDNKVEAKQSVNLADATGGVFSHAAIFLGSDPDIAPVSKVLHTGPGGAYTNEEQEEFFSVNNGIYVVRLNCKLDNKKLISNANESVGKKYQIFRLPFVSLAAWDRRCLNDGNGIYRFIPKSWIKFGVKKANRKGSEQICSGLTLKVLNDSCAEDIFPNKDLELDQFSPNCIYEEALKPDNGAQVFMLYPLPEDYVNGNPMHFIFAGLSLAATMSAQISVESIKEKYNKAFKSDS